jgi:ribosomal protein S12 methylthiotransferase accessory factor YcaO
LPKFESGQVRLFTGELRVLSVDLTSSKIAVNLEDKAFIKHLIAMRGELVPKLPSAGAAQKPQSPLAMLRTVAEALQSNGITLTVMYRRRRIVTIGAEAHPTLLQLITKTRAVALNSLYAAIKLLI